MEDSELKELMLALRKFAKDRDWEQFHSPKNLSMALSVEASELLEHFQWTPKQRHSCKLQLALTDRQSFHGVH